MARIVFGLYVPAFVDELSNQCSAATHLRNQPWLLLNFELAVGWAAPYSAGPSEPDDPQIVIDPDAPLPGSLAVHDDVSRRIVPRSFLSSNLTNGSKWACSQNPRYWLLPFCSRLPTLIRHRFLMIIACGAVRTAHNCVLRFVTWGSLLIVVVGCRVWFVGDCNGAGRCIERA